MMQQKEKVPKGQPYFLPPPTSHPVPPFENGTQQHPVPPNNGTQHPVPFFENNGLNHHVYSKSAAGGTYV